MPLIPKAIFVQAGLPARLIIEVFPTANAISDSGISIIIQTYGCGYSSGFFKSIEAPDSHIKVSSERENPPKRPESNKIFKKDAN